MKIGDTVIAKQNISMKYFMPRFVGEQPPIFAARGDRLIIRDQGDDGSLLVRHADRPHTFWVESNEIESAPTEPGFELEKPVEGDN